MNKEFQLEGQMSIFDFPECLPKTEKSNLERVKEAIETVSGIRLEENEGRLTWKNGTYTLRIYEGHYKTTDDKNRKEFISVGYQSTMEGASCPCDSVEEATARAKSHIDYINRKTIESAKERQNEKEVAPNGKWVHKCALCNEWHFNKRSGASCPHTDCVAPDFKCRVPMIAEKRETITLDINKGKSLQVNKAPDWYKKERCELCKNAELLPEYEQPVEGWGVKVWCGLHSQKVENTSKCQDYERGEVK